MSLPISLSMFNVDNSHKLSSSVLRLKKLIILDNLEGSSKVQVFDFNRNLPLSRHCICVSLKIARRQLSPVSILWNSPLHCVKICHYDWFNKQADRPIVEQNKLRRESRTENTGRKKVESEETPADAEREARWTWHTEKRYHVTWQRVGKNMV